LPGRSCRVLPNDRSFLIEELGIWRLQYPTAIDAAVNLISTSDGAQHKSGVRRYIDRTIRRLSNRAPRYTGYGENQCNNPHSRDIGRQSFLRYFSTIPDISQGIDISSKPPS
jgi:hypothetical protein